MKITRFTQQIKTLPNFKFNKIISTNNSRETYQLFHNDDMVCCFDFTNYRGIDRYYSHGEIENFKLATRYRRKHIGIKAILQAKELINQSAKEKGIKFIMLKTSNTAKDNIKKLAKHLGAYEYKIEDLSNTHFIYLTNKSFYKNIERKIYKPITQNTSSVRQISAPTA